jgi:hypothetical protein
VALIGAGSGFVLAAFVAVASMWLSEGSSALGRDWAWDYVLLVGVAGGMPVGAASALLVFGAFLAAIPSPALLRRLPTLFAFALLGSLTGVLHPLIPLLAAPLALVAGAVWVRRSWSSETTS